MPQAPNHSQNGPGISSFTGASGGWGLTMGQKNVATSEIA